MQIENPGAQERTKHDYKKEKRKRRKEDKQTKRSIVFIHDDNLLKIYMKSSHMFNFLSLSYFLNKKYYLPVRSSFSVIVANKVYLFDFLKNVLHQITDLFSAYYVILLP